jgi:hypothetical protein
MPTKKQIEEIEEQQEFENEIAEDLKEARVFAKKVFGTEPSPDVVFKTFNILQVATADEELAEDIKKATAVAANTFETVSPTPEMVLGCFKALFVGDGD